MITKFTRPRAPRDPRGFSAVELMVVMVVFGIMAAASIPAFSKSMKANKLVEASDQIESRMRLARARAVAENQPYVIGWFTQYGQLFLVRDENRNGVPDWGSEYQEGPLQIPTGITLANFSDNPFSHSYVAFNPDGSAGEGGSLLLSNDQSQSKVITLIQPSGTVAVTSPEEYSAQFSVSTN